MTSTSQPLRVGVSGATGFIGLELIRQLIQHDEFSVHAIVRRLSPNIIPLENVLVSKLGTLENDVMRTADITDAESVSNAIRGLDAVVHLAGVLDGFVGADRNRAEELNFKMGEGMIHGALKEAKRTGKKILFVHVSTAEVYGPTAMSGERADENFNQQPDSAYGKGKRDAEQVILKVCKENKNFLDLIILRPPGVYGPNEQFFFKELLELCESGWAIVCPSPSTGKVMFVHLDDVVSAIILALKNGRPNIYNICPDRGISYEEVLGVLNSSLKRSGPFFGLPETAGKVLLKLFGELIYFGKQRQRFLYHPVNIKRSMEMRLYSNENAKKNLGWTPKYEMEQGMRQVAVQEVAEGRIKERKYPPTVAAVLGLVAFVFMFQFKE